MGGGRGGGGRGDPPGRLGLPGIMGGTSPGRAQEGEPRGSHTAFSAPGRGVTGCSSCHTLGDSSLPGRACGHRPHREGRTGGTGSPAPPPDRTWPRQNSPVFPKPYHVSTPLGGQSLPSPSRWQATRRVLPGEAAPAPEDPDGPAEAAGPTGGETVRQIPSPIASSPKGL